MAVPVHTTPSMPTEIGGVEFESWQYNIAEATKSLVDYSRAFALVDGRLFGVAVEFHEHEEEAEMYEIRQQNRGFKTALIAAEVTRHAMVAAQRSVPESEKIDISGSPDQIFAGDLAQIIVAAGFNPYENRPQRHDLFAQARFWAAGGAKKYMLIGQRNTYELPKAARFIEGWNTTVALDMKQFGSAEDTYDATRYALSVARDQS